MRSDESIVTVTVKTIFVFSANVKVNSTLNSDQLFSHLIANERYPKIFSVHNDENWKINWENSATNLSNCCRKVELNRETEWIFRFSYGMNVGGRDVWQFIWWCHLSGGRHDGKIKGFNWFDSATIWSRAFSVFLRKLLSFHDNYSPNRNILSTTCFVLKTIWLKHQVNYSIALVLTAFHRNFPVQNLTRC